MLLLAFLVATVLCKFVYSECDGMKMGNTMAALIFYYLLCRLGR